MSLTVYQYRSPIGTFKILSEPSECELWFEGELRGTYRTALAAASNALTSVAGEFDSVTLEDVDVPADIEKWEIVAG